VNVSKKDYKEGLIADKNKYQFSGSALKVMFSVLSSFYNYLLQEQVVQVNPFALIRQKSKFLQKQNKAHVIRRLSNQQWETVIKVARDKASQNLSHERTVFILSCLYGMYLRISELVAGSRWTPTMDNFKDNGHSSGAITDKYIDVELRERAQSAKNKTISQQKNLSSWIKSDRKLGVLQKVLVWYHANSLPNGLIHLKVQPI